MSLGPDFREGKMALPLEFNSVRRRLTISCVPALVLVAAFVLFLSCGASRASAAADPRQEHEVFGAYVFKFCSYVDWPAKKLPQRAAPIIVGVMGDNAVERVIGEIAEIEKARGGRKVTVRRINAIDDALSCHVLYIGKERDFVPILDRIRTAGVLTVGAHDNFVKRGGMLGLVRIGDNVRFAANTQAAEAAGLKIDYSLLNLAQEVVTGKPEKAKH